MKPKVAEGSHTPYRRVALIGAIANPNVGDEAILHENLRQVGRMFGDCISDVQLLRILKPHRLAFLSDS